MSNPNDNLKLRHGVIGDAHSIGKIIFEAFSGIADKHGFPREIPSVDIGVNLASSFLSHPRFYSVVVEDQSGNNNSVRVVGSNFLDERSDIVAGVGPLTIDPQFQDKGVGRKLMINVLEEAKNKKYPAIRLLQASYHNRSLALYSGLGFNIREPISTIQGKPIQAVIPGRSVRMATEADLGYCNEICKAIHGHDRDGELRDGIKQGTAKVVLKGNEITGYTSGLAYFNHSVGFTNDDLKALIASATDGYGGAGILIPSRNTDLLRWCLANGLRIVHQLTLMTIGLYNEPAGSYMPSILY